MTTEWRGRNSAWLLWLLVKASCVSEIRRTAVRALWQQALLPVIFVGFFTFLQPEVTHHGGWPMIAIAGAVWLLFANSVRQGGMVLWHERWLLRDGSVPPGSLVAASTVVPIVLFLVHVSLVHAVLWAGPAPADGLSAYLLPAGGIALGAGVGVGILSARLSSLRPAFASAVPKLLVVSLVLTPVLYRASSLWSLGPAWCAANPLCAATELARAAISMRASPPPLATVLIAGIISLAFLCCGLLALRLPASALAELHE